MSHIIHRTVTLFVRLRASEAEAKVNIMTAELAASRAELAAAKAELSMARAELQAAQKAAKEAMEDVSFQTCIHTMLTLVCMILSTTTSRSTLCAPHLPETLVPLLLFPLVVHPEGPLSPLLRICGASRTASLTSRTDPVTHSTPSSP